MSDIIYVDLSNKKMQSYAKSLSNETAQRIIAALSEKSMTESEIAKKVDASLPTVHYNINQLKKLGVVDIARTRYSIKGKIMRYYRLKGKHIIMTLTKSSDEKEKIKALFPTVLWVGLIALLTQGFMGTFLQHVDARGAKEAAFMSQAAESSMISLVTGVQFFLIGAVVGIGLYYFFLRRR